MQFDVNDTCVWPRFDAVPYLWSGIIGLSQSVSWAEISTRCWFSCSSRCSWGNDDDDPPPCVHLSTFDHIVRWGWVQNMFFLSWLSQVGKRLPSCFSWFPRFKLNPWHARRQRWSVPATMQEISQVIECRAGLVNWEVITRRWFYFKCYLGQCLRLPIIIPTGEMLFFNGTYETIG